MTHVTCRLTAKNRDHLRNPTFGNRVWATFFAVRGHFGIERSVHLSVPWRSCLGYRHAGYLQLCHHRPPEMCGLRTCPWMDVDPPRFLPLAGRLSSLRCKTFLHVALLQSCGNKLYSNTHTHTHTPRSRQITTPAPHHSVFYRPDALPAAQPSASKH